MLYQLSYGHHNRYICRGDHCGQPIMGGYKTRPYAIIKLARQAGFEPATLGLEGRCSIQMSYWRNKPNVTVNQSPAYIKGEHKARPY